MSDPECIVCGHRFLGVEGQMCIVCEERGRNKCVECGKVYIGREGDKCIDCEPLTTLDINRIWRDANTSADIEEGLKLIVKERHRQAQKYSKDHDLDHIDGALVKAAVCFLLGDDHVFDDRGVVSTEWPWSEKEWRKWSRGDRVTQLAKAGALIAAEIDRLLEAQKRAMESNNDR